jgi:aspartate aminotransferase-like enzyme
MSPYPPSRPSYHHTGMVSMWYAMREALAIVGDEGLEAMWERHYSVWAGGRMWASGRVPARHGHSGRPSVSDLT